MDLHASCSCILSLYLCPCYSHSPVTKLSPAMRLANTYTDTHTQTQWQPQLSQLQKVKVLKWLQLQLTPQSDGDLYRHAYTCRHIYTHMQTACSVQYACTAQKTV